MSNQNFTTEYVKVLKNSRILDIFVQNSRLFNLNRQIPGFPGFLVTLYITNFRSSSNHMQSYWCSLHSKQTQDAVFFFEQISNLLTKDHIIALKCLLTFHPFQ